MDKSMLTSLDGLSVGDALGAQYFVPGTSPVDLAAGIVPPAPWPWTDDTEMAASVVAELRDHGSIDQDRLALTFAERCEPYRGYGPGTVVLLHEIRDGADWRMVARSSFGGNGSLGNGAAMRVAPLGAYFQGRPEIAAEQARLSAEVTHAHPERIEGAVAVAVAAAEIVSSEGARDLLERVCSHLAPGKVAMGVEVALELLGRSWEEVAYVLGNGARVTAMDTVPFCLWVAASHRGDFRQAITTCVLAGGDVDTTAAIVGGIVAAEAAPPIAWVEAREPLPNW